MTDPDQAYVLGELICYLSDERSGAVAFQGMGRAWTDVRDGARNGTLRKSDSSVAAVAAGSPCGAGSRCAQCPADADPRDPMDRLTAV